MNEMEMRQECSAHGEAIAALLEQTRTLFAGQERIEKNQEALLKLATSVQVIANKQEDVCKGFDAMKINVATMGRDIKAEVDELKYKPAQRWEKMTNSIIGGLVLMIIGYIAARLTI